MSAPTRRKKGEPKLASAPEGWHIMLTCPHCDQKYEAEIGNNPLVKHGLMVTPLPIEISVSSEVEQ